MCTFCLELLTTWNLGVVFSFQLPSSWLPTWISTSAGSLGVQTSGDGLKKSSESAFSNGQYPYEPTYRDCGGWSPSSGTTLHGFLDRGSGTIQRNGVSAESDKADKSGQKIRKNTDM